MAKPFRRVIGSVLKAKDAGKSDYIAINQDVVLKKGQFLQLQSAKAQLTSLEQAVLDGKLDPEYAEKQKERLLKIPEFVRFEIVLLEPKTEQAS